MAAKRITIAITDEDKLWLEGYSKVHKISVAAALRQGISQLKKIQGQRIYKHLVESTCGLWEKGNGLAYQQETRVEWG